MPGGSFPSGRLQPSVRCAVPAQLLAFRRFFFCAERFRHRRELPETLARRLWLGAVYFAAVGQGVSAPFCDAGAFCRLRTAESPEADAAAGDVVCQPDSAIQHAPGGAEYDSGQSAAYPEPACVRFPDLECAELED